MLDDDADQLLREEVGEFRDEGCGKRVEAAALVLFDAARRGHCMYVQSVRYPYSLPVPVAFKIDAKFRWSTVELNEPLIRFNGTKPWESGAGAQKGLARPHVSANGGKVQRRPTRFVVEETLPLQRRRQENLYCLYKVHLTLPIRSGSRRTQP